MNHSRGFTLLEMLIGMTLLGFILTLLFGGFRLASVSWNTVEERAERAADEQAGRSLVRQLITYAQPLHLKHLTEQRLAFEGGGDALRLVAPLGQIGLRAVELTIEPEDKSENQPQGLRIVLRNGPLRYDAAVFSESITDQRKHLLLGDLSEATFSYFGKEKNADDPQWHDTWLNSDQFPLLVRLHLVGRDIAPFDLDMTPMANGKPIPTSRIVAGPERN